MGKAKKIKFSRKDVKLRDLGGQIESDRFAHPSIRNKQRNAQAEEQEYVDCKLSKRILAQAIQQQQELVAEQQKQQQEEETCTARGAVSAGQEQLVLGDPDRVNIDQSDDSDDSDAADDSSFLSDAKQIHISAEDEAAVRQFMPADVKPRRLLSDLVMERLHEKETEINSRMSDSQSVIAVESIDPRVRRMFESIGTVLSRYRAGKIPKAFKVIPQLKNWEHMLYLTKPHNWSASATFCATRLFAAHLKDDMAQRFYNLVLLPRVRDDIAFYKKLNPHLFLALKKALYKPAAFMKGLLLPLCESGDCTLREAVIVGSVLARCSVPVLHSGAALLKIAQMPYTGASSVFLRVLIDKKYALPYQVIDALHSHFMRFYMEERLLPVLWHQALLAFVRRYGADMSEEQRELLIDLTNRQRHDKITPEVRCELLRVRPSVPVYASGEGGTNAAGGLAVVAPSMEVV